VRWVDVATNCGATPAPATPPPAADVVNRESHCTDSSCNELGADQWSGRAATRTALAQSSRLPSLSSSFTPSWLSTPLLPWPSPVAHKRQPPLNLLQPL